MTHPHSDGKNITFSFQGNPMLLTNTAAGVWRLRYAGNGALDDLGAAQTLAKDLGESFDDVPLAVSFAATETGFAATAADGSAVQFDGKTIRFCDETGKVKREVTAIAVKPERSTVRLAAEQSERFYGTGERFDKVNRRGKRVQIYAADRWCQTRGNSYLPIPFLLSSNGSGVYMNRFEHSVFDTCSFGKKAIRITQKYAPIDLYVFVSDSPAEILKHYCSLTGFAPMPPAWSFGTLVCRYHPEFSTKQGVFAMADAMRENGFPWDAVILEGFRMYGKEKWPELRKISEGVHALGKRVMVYEPCGRFPGDCEANYGLDDSYAVKSENGVYLTETRSLNPIDNLHPKKMRCIDITDVRSLLKWEEIWGDLVEDIGIDGAKIDFCEQFPDKPFIRFADGRNPMQAHHWYPTLYNILRFRHFNTRPGGGVNFSRGGGIGAQRYPFVWAGDQRREFKFLLPVIRAALSLGLSGVPFVSWDMGGYIPAYRPYDKKHEDRVFLRALEFTAFSANIQTHGRVKRPYDFDDDVKAVYRAYAMLHDCLRPYLLEQAEITCKTGLPLMRHLILYDPADKKAQDSEDEYMLGCGLLIAPVLDRTEQRDVYLPKGKWVNIFDGSRYDGGKTIRHYRVPLAAVPVFRLEGAASAALLPALENAKTYIEEIVRLSAN